MLYDPKWEQKVEIKHPSLEGLVAWLEGMPPEAGYAWLNCEGLCLIGLYGTAIGLGENWHDFHNGDFLPHLSVASNKPHTFGAALGRARDALAARHPS
jgi:hypothetical protein